MASNGHASGGGASNGGDAFAWFTGAQSNSLSKPLICFASVWALLWLSILLGGSTATFLIACTNLSHSGRARDWLPDWLGGSLAGWLEDRISDWLGGSLAGWLEDRFSDWLGGSVAGWLEDCFSDWLGGSLIFGRWIWQAGWGDWLVELEDASLTAGR